MAPIFILLAVTIPGLISADIGSTTSTCNVNDLQPIKEPHNVSFDVTPVYNCFTRLVDTYLNKTRDNGCTKVVDIKTKPYFENCLKDSKCTKDSKCVKCTEHNKFNATINSMAELVDFSLSDNKYKDFVSNGGSKCINKLRPEIIKCIQVAIGVSGNSSGQHTNTNHTTGEHTKKNHTSDDHTHGHTSGSSTSNDTCTDVFIFNSAKAGGCDELNQLKKCVTKEIQKETTACKLDHEKFVSSMFDFVKNKTCTKNTRTATNVSKRASKSIYLANIMFLVMTAFIAL